jgi:AAA domain/DnaB-like helicase N terminal domain
MSVTELPRAIIPLRRDIEQELLATMAQHPAAVRAGRAVCSATSFTLVAHGLVFDAIVALSDSGITNLSTPLVIAELERQGIQPDVYDGKAGIVALLNEPGPASSARRLAHEVASAAALREVQRVCAAAVNRCADTGTDVAQLVDDLRADLVGVALPTVDLPPNLERFDEFLARAPLEVTWLIPGMLPKACRCLVIAPEGAGKSMVARAVTIMASQGKHPFTLRTIPAIRVLLIDAENPDEVIATTCRPINERVMQDIPFGSYDEDRAWIWHERRRLNLRSGSGRATLERVVEHVKPDLVCLGPLYKLYAPLSGERDAQAAEEMADALDELVARYGIALMIEHHAPKSQGGRRPLDPFGSQRWMAWPELGIRLTPKEDDQNTLVVSRFRGDRLPVQWPTSMTRGRVWPWDCRWSDDEWQRSDEPPGDPF